MCGRYGLDISLDEVRSYYDLRVDDLDYKRRVEIFPTSDNLIFDGEKLFYANWGFEVSFSKRPIINARAETVNEKFTFAPSFKNSRCLIPASHFYEWRDEGGPKKVKYLIKLEGRSIFSLAGIYRLNGEKIEFSILTTASRGKMQDYHSRMPVILNRDQGDYFLREANLVKNAEFINSVSDGNLDFIPV